MRYIDYLIKCIIRRLVRIIFKPKMLITILFILLLLTLSFYNDSYAAESGIYDVYTSFNNELIKRLDKASSTTSFYNYFNNSSYSFLVYFGNINGSDMFTNSYNTSNLNVAFYKTSLDFSSFENQVKWAGCPSSQGRIRSSTSNKIVVFSFDENSQYVTNEIDVLQIPQELYNYRSPVISEYLRNQKNVEQITDSITEGTDKINDSINDTNNFIKDDTITDDSMSVDTTGMSVDGQGDIDNFFTSFLNTVYNAFTGINDKVETISISMPYNIPPIVLSSDLLSKHIKNTALYPLIQVFWTFVFGKYIVMFVKRMFDWLSTGEIAEKGVFGFISWLDNYNSIIKSWMM